MILVFGICWTGENFAKQLQKLRKSDSELSVWTACDRSRAAHVAHEAHALEASPARTSEEGGGGWGSDRISPSEHDAGGCFGVW